MSDDRLERVSNIKATAWTTLLVFSFLGYVLLTEILKGMLTATFIVPSIDDVGDESLRALKPALILAWASLAYIGLVVYGAIGLLKQRLNGLIIFQATTLILVLALVGYAWYVFTMIEIPVGDDENDIVASHFYFGMFQAISYLIIILIIAWTLTKVNLMLFRKEYRNEFE
jgi:hypothetical protein